MVIGASAIVTACGSVETTTDAPTFDANVAPRPDGSPDAPSGIYVDAVTGSDTNTGDFANPYRTITRAIAMAPPGMTIHVRPGLYDAMLGEVFPLRPAGVTLIGDEASKGAATTISANDPSFLGATVMPGASATIAGFTLRNTAPPTVGPMIVIVNANDVTVRNNTLTGAPDSGIYVNGGAAGTISGNVIQQSNWSGIAFVGGAGYRLEGNTATQNRYGVTFDVAGGDLGGGATGSMGGNILSCNNINDVYAGATVSARNNRWDHVPPTTIANGDIYQGGGATVDAGGATLAAMPCP